jgi:hypothetical protein
MRKRPLDTSPCWAKLTELDGLKMLIDFVIDALAARRVEGRAATARARGNGALINIGAMGGRVPQS